MEAMACFAGKQRDEWISRTWDNGKHPDASLLIELRTRADAYRAIPDTSYDDWIEAHGHDSQA
jgi:hypothetical protein